MVISIQLIYFHKKNTINLYKQNIQAIIKRVKFAYQVNRNKMVKSW